MVHRVWFLVVACIAAFAACGNGTSLPQLPVRSLLSRASASTTAWGVVVDDPSGTPLANVPVRLEPWKHGCVKTSPHTASCPGYLPWHATTNAAGRFELRGVPDNDYLLVIGSDSPGDLVRPTIHDHILLSGGMQHLRAPTLPTIPCDAANYKVWCQGIAPSPGVTAFPRPAVEKSGDYRLATIDPQKERPCDVAFNAERSKRRLPLVVVDEWLTENSREIDAYRGSVRRSAVPFPVPYLVLRGNIVESGGNNCQEFVGFGLKGVPGSLDPRTRMIAAAWYLYADGREATGVAQFPIDVRLSLAQLAGPWP